MVKIKFNNTSRSHIRENGEMTKFGIRLQVNTEILLVALEDIPYNSCKKAIIQLSPERWFPIHPDNFSIVEEEEW